MGEFRTTDEIRARAVAAMGQEMGELYVDLYNSVSLLHLKWQEFRELFAMTPDRTALLKRAAPFFFGFLQRTLLADMMLHLSRLTDPPATGRRQNLTVCRLPALVPAHLQHEPASRLTTVDARVQFARAWRNRQLVHTDLLTARGLHPDPLPDANRQAIEDALAALRDLMHWFESHHFGAPVGYEHVIGGLGGADALVRHLARALPQESEAAMRQFEK